MAEREGFEPSVRLPVQRFSRLAIQTQIGTGGKVNSRWLQARDLNLHTVGWAKSATTASIAHQLIEDALVSADGIKRSTFVVIPLDGALIGMLEKP